MRKSNKNIRESRRLLEGVYVSTDADGISLRDVLDIYLTWNGISGYTDDIMEIFENGEAWLSQADDEDLSSLKRQLGIRDITKESVRRSGKRLTESDEVDRKGFGSLIKYDVFDPKGNYAVLSDGNFRYAFWADNDEEAKKIFAKYGTDSKPKVDNRGKAVVESRQLNEGPGAGYRISGKIVDVEVNNITINTEEDDKYIYYTVEGDIDANLYDVGCSSYYYGGEIPETPIKIEHLKLSAGKDWELPTPTEDDIFDLLTGVKIDAWYGGGWSHSTFGGALELDYNGMEYSSWSYEIDELKIRFTDPKAVDAIDKYATGDNVEVEFMVVDENGYEIEPFDTEEEAIEFAQENGYPAVETKRWYWYYLGNGDYDSGDELDTEIVWEAE